MASPEIPQDSSGTATERDEVHSPPWPPRRMASTKANPTSREEDDGNFFRNAQWSPDGNCVIAQRDNHTIETYVLYAQLQNMRYADEFDASTAHVLEANMTTPPAAEPIHALAVSPLFDVADGSSTVMLRSIQEHPVQLINPLSTSSEPLASYSWVDSLTEAYKTAASLAFTSTGTHFVAGARDCVACFDLSLSGCKPVVQHKTIPSRKMRGFFGGSGYKGIVSALDISSEGILATGTFTSWIALYGAEGRGELMASWQIEEEIDDSMARGSGITSLRWSPCGRYLYVASRCCDRIVVYDVRVTGRQLGILTGRKSNTSQRLGFDVVPDGNGGHGIWAGGTDGIVRVWDRTNETNGIMAPSNGWRAHADAVSSVVVHPSGTAAVTCSGQRHDRLFDTDRTVCKAGEDTSDTDLDSTGPSSSSSVSTSTSPPQSRKSSSLQSVGADYSLKIWSL
ncbi:MAG: hypothetical protein M1828_004621 [Chrysothrix sp. TS-e1954]|nr:MAG: hypothetical protein M1828_004621 [Chrysothrix sp. TS-e1954]